LPDPITPYNGCLLSPLSGFHVRRPDPTLPGSFGSRLEHFRKTKGFTQTELGQEAGLSQRMVAYYETEGGNPPLDLFPRLAKALGVSVDQLVGLDPKQDAAPKDNRLQRRVARLEKLPPKKRKQLIQLMDAFLER
jgi:transcriptional regulator with XRE-family HTH domain